MMHNGIPMQKESKANLIFVVVLIITMVPGVTMLIRRKLNGDRTTSALPDPVPYALAYNQPPPTPPGLQRMEPPFVRDWVSGIVRDKIGPDVRLLTVSNQPVVSDGYFTQAVALVPSADGGSDLWLLIWRDAPPPSDTDPQVTAPARDNAVASAVSLQPIDIPPDVRHALQSVGYIDPPPRTWLGRWHFAASAAPLGELKLLHSVGQPRSENLPLP